MAEYITKGSDERQTFSSGAVRDTTKGKPRYDLISLIALRREAELMARGAERYGDRNWELGMPLSRYAESGLRHFFQYLEGDRTEDHLAAVRFNAAAMQHFEGTEWDDLNEPETHAIFTDDETMAAIEEAEHERMVGETEWEQMELPFEVEQSPKQYADNFWNKHDRANEGRSYINWPKLKLDVDEGRADASEINWPEGHPYRKVDLRKASEG